MIFVVEELTKSVRMKVIGMTLFATGFAVGVMRLPSAPNTISP